MKNKLFVGNLSYDTTTDSLKEYFSSIGEITDAVVISDRETGRSKGFGFVTFSNDDQASQAVDQLNDTELDGRPISVSIARPKEERPRNDFGGGQRSSF
jgi:RNA recognition motif-containing protein